MVDYKFLKFAYKILQSNLNTLKNPFKLNFVITYNCNLKCKICKIWRKKSVNELTIGEIEKFVKINNFFSWVSLTGGEPFLRKDVVNIVRIFKENCPDFYLLNIPTNGSVPTLITKKVLELVELNIPKIVITISIDGPRDLHNSMRGKNSSWDCAIETFKSLKDIANENIKCFIAYTLTPLNVGTFEQTYNEIKNIVPDLVPSDFHINLFHYSEHYYSNLRCGVKYSPEYKKELSMEIDKIIKMKGRNFNLIKFVEEEYVRLAKKFIETNKTPLQCKALLTSIFMDPSGNIYPCSVWNRKLGNIRDFNYNLRKIFEQEITKQTKKEIKQMKCYNCWSPCEANQTILSNLFSVLKVKY